MKMIFSFFLVSLCSGLMLAIETSDMVSKMASDLSNRDFESEAANALKTEKGEEVATEELYRALLSVDSAEKEAAVVRILLQFDPYPFDALEALHLKSKNSIERAYTLHLMNLGINGENDIGRLMEHAKASLSDAGPGLRRYGEAAGYAPDGSRPKDVAYNILVFRSELKEVYPIVNVDNFSISKRDDFVEKLAAELGIVLTPKVANGDEASSETGDSRKQQAKQKQFSEMESASESGKAESPSLPKWALAVIVVAVLGILTLLIRAFLRSRGA